MIYDGIEVEEIRDIPSYEGLYAVTSSGRIWSYPKQIGFRRGKGSWRKLDLHKAGYLQVILQKDGKLENLLLHRIMALTWIPNPDNLPEINHKDGNKINNRILNLEWVTSRQNMHHSTLIGLQHKNRASSYINVSLRKDNNMWVSRLLISGKRHYIGQFLTELEAALAYNRFIVDNRLDIPLNEVPNA